MIAIFHKLTQLFDAIVFPAECLLCQNHHEADNDAICEACWDNLCEQPIYGKFEVGQTGELPGFSGWNFESGVKDVIHGLKYDGRQKLASVLGSALWKRVPKPESLGKIGIIPVPLHPNRIAERGFNQSLLIAEALAQENAEKVCVVDCLQRIKDTPQQAMLNRDERIKNVGDAFVLKKESESLTEFDRIVLLDDVCTTGATLLSCQKAIQSLDPKYVVAWIIARAEAPGIKNKNLSGNSEK